MESNLIIVYCKVNRYVSNRKNGQWPELSKNILCQKFFPTDIQRNQPRAYLEILFTRPNRHKNTTSPTWLMHMLHREFNTPPIPLPYLIHPSTMLFTLSPHHWSLPSPLHYLWIPSSTWTPHHTYTTHPGIWNQRLRR